MLVLQPRSFLFWTAFTTRIARSWPGPVPVWLTRAIAAAHQSGSSGPRESHSGLQIP
jgi:hypothetical protein